jgi:hypothetical protein
MSHNSVIGNSDVLEVPVISYRAREAGNSKMSKGRFPFSHDVVMLWLIRHLEKPVRLVGLYFQRSHPYEAASGAVV